MTKTTSALAWVKAEMQRSSGYLEFDPMRAAGFSVRYFGSWEVPADEEDDGDYDWKVPTAETRKALDTLIAKANAKFGTSLMWQNEGEKCWLRIEVR